jgi:hypothetical protein
MSTSPDPATSSPEPTATGSPTAPGSPTATGSPASPATPAEPRLRYRLLTGSDDRSFCERVSAALADGYRLYGGPAVTFDGTQVIAAQAVVLDAPTATVVPA